MFMISWQLSILAFISVPVITILSKWYGQFIRSLTKLMQSKLAEGNSISEAAISSMSTVRAFDAAPTEYKEFQGSMDKVRRLFFQVCDLFPNFELLSLVFVVSFYSNFALSVFGTDVQIWHRLQWLWYSDHILATASHSSDSLLRWADGSKQRYLEWRTCELPIVSSESFRCLFIHWVHLQLPNTGCGCR